MRGVPRAARFGLALVLCLGACAAALAAEAEPLAGQAEQAGPAAAQESTAAGAAGHAAPSPGHGQPDLNPLDWKTDLALWTAVVFVVLLFVLGKFAWGPIADGLDKREQRIAGEIAAAERANADAKALLADYQRKLDAAAADVRQMIDKAKHDAEAAGEKIVERARGEADAEKRRALADIELATAGALEELARQSATLAVQLAGKIVRTQLTPADHATLIDEAVAEFSKFEPGKN